MAESNIAYIPQQQIDKAKWDNCINTAANGLLYARSYYLDTTAITWHALVLNDYEAVMPLPVRKKWIFNYLFEPPMTPVLGVFGNNIPSGLVSGFLQAVPANIKFWDYSLNHFNPLAPGVYPAFTRNNFVLPLNNSYENMQQQYHENTRRNIKKSLKMGCVVRKDIAIDEVINICKMEFPKFTTVTPGLFEQLKKIFLHPGHSSVIYGIENEKGELLASAAFVFFNKRVYYWLVGNTPKSRQYSASSLLVDAFIQDYQDQPLLLDFEGSDNAGVADFYKKFGAQPEPFTTIYYNKLPFPFKFYKKPPKHYQPLTGNHL
jgi:hypothetical protein